MQWNPQQYLRYTPARILAVLDLVARLVPKFDPAANGRPQRIVDLGCGPGMSTEVLAGQWPQAEVCGVDTSLEMLAVARKSLPGLQFIEADIRAWAAQSGAPWDLVFANSSLQWIPEHAALLPQLFARVAPGGALAFQVPASVGAPVGQIPRELANRPEWREYFPPGAIQEWNAASLPAYYDALAPLARHLELWDTEYLQIMPTHLDILEWYLGSGLRPFMEALPDEAARQRFCDAYWAGLRQAYPAQSDGKVLFPFTRRFAIAVA